MSLLRHPAGTRRPRPATSRRRGLGACAGALVGLVVFVAVPGIQPGAGASAGPLAGSQGVVTSLPSTSSAVTVSGQGAFPGLRVTVNQTQNLVSQAISVSWTGGTTTQSPSAFQSNYLQIFECWGDPQADPAHAADPGPPPSQCQFGAEAPTSAPYPVKSSGYEYSRLLSQPSWSDYAGLVSAGAGWIDPSNQFLVEPFRAVDGTTIDKQADYDFDLDLNNPKPFWMNPYFRFGTSNELDFARTYENGTGQALFQVQTGLQAPGLGCGQDLQRLAGGGTKTPQCWLVVVPRSTPAVENPAGLTNENVITSPLAPQAWANRIAIPLGFNPVGTSCSINADAQQIIGSELATSAVSSWQPSLCAQPGSPSYGYIENSDDQARQNLVSPAYGSAGMSVFSSPADPTQVSAANPVVYAPLTLSGVVVAFNIHRVPALVGSAPQPDEVGLSGTQVAHVYLTPRLMAKLLTQSYQAQLRNITASKPSGYEWIQKNPVDLLTDPDFLQFNPEFALLSTTQASDAGTALVEQASSDAAATVWRWILADPEAASWLSGKPDRWGMRVNPLYSTSASVNTAGAPFGVPTPESYPKSDPYCTDTHQLVTGPPALPARPICILDWSPYALTMHAAAAGAGAANDGAKTTFNPSAVNPNSAWTANGPQVPGTNFILSITDSVSAAQYGLQTASLSRSGDDPADPAARAFVAPDGAGLAAGERAMTSSPVTGVLTPNPSTKAAGAYPLSLVTYAATRPVTLSPAARQQYATFLLYAIGDGQTPGVEVGQLPPGYVPLPGALRLETLGAVNSILHPPAVATTTSSDATANGAAGGDTFATGSGDVGTTSVPVDSSSSSAGAPSGAAAGRGADIRALSAVHTSWFGSGAVRWTLPLVLLIGIGAALGALLLGRPRRPTVSGSGPP